MAVLNLRSIHPFRFFVLCESEEETNTLWEKLIEGGKALIPIGKYDWSERYGWLQDRFGLTWQISLNGDAPIRQKNTILYVIYRQPVRNGRKSIKVLYLCFLSIHLQIC
jgi:hypothetical protein